MTLDELKSTLERDCLACKGTGREEPLPNGHEPDCEVCAGRGSQLTEAGEYLMDLIGHHTRDESYETVYGTHGFVGELVQWLP